MPAVGGQVLAADGATVWRLDAGDGTGRWLRLGKDAAPYQVPAGWAVYRCCWPDVDAALAKAPGLALSLWRMAETSPAWGWRVRQMLDDSGAVDGWLLVIISPGGEESRFTFMRGELVSQTQTPSAVGAQIAP